MKHLYLLAALLLGSLGQQAQAQTTAWRPFRPSFIYAFAKAASPGTLHTLRVDSAYATAGGDSVYAFNRLLRPLSGTNSLHGKSRNNLLGARLRWQPGTHDFYLEANVEPTLGTAQATTLLLRPRAAVSSTWVASTQPALTATLSSRTLGSVGTAADSLATITLSNGQMLVISKHYGIVQGPEWLMLTTGSTWYQPSVPQASLGFYDPQKLFALHIGDELGYDLIDYAFGSGSVVCSMGYMLRRITSRQLTADSLVLRFSQQQRATTSGAPGCSAAGMAFSAVSTGRWAFSLRTGRSPQFSPFTLLTGEYAVITTATPPHLLMGRSVDTRAAGSGCLAGTQTIAFAPMYPYQNQTNIYVGGVDEAAYINEFTPALGLGPITLSSTINRNYSLTYYNLNGISCGDYANFNTLLPGRAAATAIATLHPNPASEAATLTLAAPTQPSTVLVLSDALGRCVWRAEAAAGQTTLLIPLANQPAGLYLVQLLVPSTTPLIWKLQH